MAIIADRVLEGAYQVTIRWYVVGSQRYPADENEYFSTYYEQLEPGQEFVLADPAFNLAEINEDVTDIEYVIRDFCHIQSLIPQFTDLTYFQSGRADIDTFITADANEGDTTIEVDTTSGGTTPLAAGVAIQIGPLQWDVRTIINVTGTVLTLDTPLDRGYASGTGVGYSSALMNYPDGDPSTTIARIYDTNGDTRADAVVVQHALYFDTSETVKRYYYTAALERPFNGARGFGESVNGTVVHNGETIFGGWWAMGDTDNVAAERAELITADGTVIAVRDGDFPFLIRLTYSADGESSACVSEAEETYFGNHSLFKDDGFTLFVREDGTAPAEGYYAWTSTLTSDLNQRFVKYWDGFAFLPGIVETGLVDNCPLAVTNNIGATLYNTEQDIACETGGTSTTLYWEGNSFSTGGVTAIYTDQYGPASDFPSTLSTTYIAAAGAQFLWSPPNLTGISPTCADDFCQDPTAANTGLPLPCVYPGTYCPDANASNHNPSPGAYDQPDYGVCEYSVFTATLHVDASAVSGDFIIDNNGPDGGNNGENFSVTASIRLGANQEWVTEPSETSYTFSGTFSGSSVSDTWVIPAGETQDVVQPIAGCNTMGAVNYLAGSDGNGECFFSIGEFAGSSTDTGACDAFDTGGSLTTLVRSDDDDRIRIWNGTTTTGGADGWYSDGDTSYRYQNGNLITQGACLVVPAIPTCEGESVSISLNGSVDHVFGLSCNYTVTSSSGAIWPGNTPREDFVGFGSFPSPYPAQIGFPGTYYYQPAMEFDYFGTTGTVICAGTGVTAVYPEGGASSCPVFTTYTIT